MVGRDIGTVVMPDAPLKLYITASPEERARRRWLDRRNQGTCGRLSESYWPMSTAAINLTAAARFSPLRAAEDAIIIDNTDRSPAEILEEIVTIILAQSAGESSRKRENG